MKQAQTETKQNAQKTIRVIGKLIPAGTTKDGKQYNAFVAWKIEIAKKLYDLHFCKGGTDSDAKNLEDMANAVKNGTAKEFDITCDVWKDERQKTKYDTYFCRNITGDPVAYFLNNATSGEELPY